MRPSFVILVLFWIIHITPVYAEQVVKYGVLDIDYLPYQKIESGKPIGSDADIIQGAFQRMDDYTLEFVLLPTKRAFQEFAKGTVDISTRFHSDTLEEHALFTQTPLHFSVYKLAVLKGHEFKFDSMADILDKSLAVIRGNSLGNDFAQYVSRDLLLIHYTDDAITQLQMLLRKRVNAIPSNTEITMRVAKHLGVQDQIVFLPKPITAKREYHIVISKKSSIKNLKHFNKSLSSALMDMEVDGTLKKIYWQYGLPMHRFQ